LAREALGRLNRAANLGPRPQITAAELASAEKILREDRDAYEHTKAKTASGLRRPSMDPTSTEESLRTLTELCARYGTLEEIDVRGLLLSSRRAASKSLMAIYDAVCALKSSGKLADVKTAEQISPEIVRRLESGKLSTAERRTLKKAALFELYRLLDPVDVDESVRTMIGEELRSVHKVAGHELERHHARLEMPLRERYARQANALRVLLREASSKIEKSAPSTADAARIVSYLDWIAWIGDKTDLSLLARMKCAPGKASEEIRKGAANAFDSVKKLSEMKIVFVAMEAKPYCNVGGLSNVMLELPRALAKRGHKVSVLLPRHRTISEPLQYTGIHGAVFGKAAEGFALFTDAPKDGVSYYFIQNDHHFSGSGRNHLYGPTNGSSYHDNMERYDFLSAATPIAIRGFSRTEMPDVVQLNEHHVAKAAIYIREDPSFTTTTTVYGVHNFDAGYQGRFDAGHLEQSRTRGLHLQPEERIDGSHPLLHDGQVNLSKPGLHYADGSVFVSDNYKKECIKDAGSFAPTLHALEDRGRVLGILNGIDTSSWCSATDRYLAEMGANFSLADLSGKARTKAIIQERRPIAREQLEREPEAKERFHPEGHGLLPNPNATLVGYVGRIADQKGFHDILSVMRRTLEDPRTTDTVQFVIVGGGDAWYMNQIRELVARHPGKVAFDPAYGERKEREVIAASDLFLMPSKFEPCGLPQMYCLRYATVPIVRAVGGLEESIDDYDPASKTGTGFKFSADVHAAFDRALSWHKQSEDERMPLLRNGAIKGEMFDWDRAAAPEYEAFYRRTIHRRMRAKA
jgi:starch synthase